MAKNNGRSGNLEDIGKYILPGRRKKTVIGWVIIDQEAKISEKPTNNT